MKAISPYLSNLSSDLLFTYSISISVARLTPFTFINYLNTKCASNLSLSWPVPLPPLLPKLSLFSCLDLTSNESRARSLELYVQSILYLVNTETNILFQSGSMTKYLIKCAADVASDECGIPNNGMVVAQGSSTVSLSYGMDDV